MCRYGKILLFSYLVIYFSYQIKEDKQMDNLEIIDLQELLDQQSVVIFNTCGPSHSCGGGR
ncbi:hypothetical protein GCM10011510_09930 [Streptococcus himalayensis]|uniref:Uncharacterized protein n=1 Tax=Streptococcus himalayensis TaxID=1888195 RepID=A0A917A6F8_9STRE|nr:hypothetical protein GCM10011510_09930 [Streptococcus himalayensis]